MTLIVDTAPIVALSERRAPRRGTVRRQLLRERGDLIVSAQITAEIDYFMTERCGEAAALNFARDLASAIHRLMQQYRDLAPGLADLSIVVLAYRFNTTRILTFDQKHFRAMKPLQGGSFTLLPLDDPDPVPPDA
jgi:predicted nucleic acid-binding protein